MKDDEHTIFQWIGLRENLRETMVFTITYRVCFCQFSHHPILWILGYHPWDIPKRGLSWIHLISLKAGRAKPWCSSTASQRWITTKNLLVSLQPSRSENSQTPQKIENLFEQQTLGTWCHQNNRMEICPANMQPTNIWPFFSYQASAGFTRIIPASCETPSSKSWCLAIIFRRIAVTWSYISYFLSDKPLTDPYGTSYDWLHYNIQVYFCVSPFYSHYLLIIRYIQYTYPLVI